LIVLEALELTLDDTSKGQTGGETPDPLVPAEVDLRGLEYMPLFGGRLFSSRFDAKASDSEFRAALNLWWQAWIQVPAASLPNDDDELCKLAGLARNLDAWHAVRDRALHGFTLASDGRFYHEILAQHALAVWMRRVDAREKMRRWRGSASSHSENQERNGNVKAEVKVSKGKGKVKKETPLPPLPDWIDPEAWRGYEASRQKLGKVMTPRARELTLRKLDGMRSRGLNPNTALDNSTANSWIGVFDPRDEAAHPVPASAGIRQPRSKQAELEARNATVAAEWLAKQAAARGESTEEVAS
jgi:hypothetical protein